MTDRKISKTKNALLLKLLGLALCIIPVTACILCYFPVWRARGGEALFSGLTVLLLALASVPVYRLMKQAFRSPAAYTVWLAAFIIFLLLSNIANEMVIISFTGFIGNALGAVCFRIARGGRNEGL